ncbi:MAG: SOS response-associated peptidase [Geminicoccales bacterium]
MCGRFLLKSPIDELRKLLDIDQRPNLRPRYNIAPSQDVVIARHSPRSSMPDGVLSRELASVRWGLIPPWAEDPNVGYKMINARAETVDRLPSYREAYRKRRCLIPADGFFEWKASADGDKKAPKQPYLIRRVDQEPFVFAGLYERWQPLGGTSAIETCTIVTTSANRKLASIHHRMPVILARGDHSTWLDPATDGRDLLRPCPPEWLETLMIGDRVNKPANDDPSVLEVIDRPIEPAQGSLF